MIKQSWLNIINDLKKEGLELFPESQIEKAADFLIREKIDMFNFNNNLEYLLKAETLSFQQSVDTNTHKITKSIEVFRRRQDRPMLPIGLIAAFPDVLAWFNQRDIQQKIENDETFYNMFDFESVDKSETKVQNHEYPVSDFEKIVNAYKTYTRQSLEVAVADTQNDVYKWQEVREKEGMGNNFEVIASITKMYLDELKCSYQDRFESEESIIATAGILDAQNYIFMLKQIKVDEIISIAVKQKDKKNKFLEFLIEFETLLLSKDSPQIPLNVVKDSCESQRSVIGNAVNSDIGSKYVKKEEIKIVVNAFMESSKFSELRKMIGIIEA